MRSKDLEIEKELIRKHELLNSPKYKKYTEQFLLALGKELDQKFSGVSYVLTARYKSEESFKGKKEKILKREEDTQKNIYDNIGVKIVVTHISDKVDHANCKELIRIRKDKSNEKSEKVAEYKIILQEVEGMVKENTLLRIEEIKDVDLNNYNTLKNGFLGIDSIKAPEDKIQAYRRLANNCKEIMKNKSINKENEMINLEKQIINLKEQLILQKMKILVEVKKNIQSLSELYYECDKKCNDLFATYMLQQIPKDSKVMKSLRITQCPGRFKRHTGSKHYYVANHNCFKSLKLMPDWGIEMQTTSDYHNQDASEGKAKHSEKDGKMRVLPSLESITFSEDVKKSVPETIIYISGSDEIYHCSEYENFYSHYKEVLDGKDNYHKQARKILENPNLESTER